MFSTPWLKGKPWLKGGFPSRFLRFLGACPLACLSFALLGLSSYYIYWLSELEYCACIWTQDAKCHSQWPGGGPRAQQRISLCSSLCSLGSASMPSSAAQ